MDRKRSIEYYTNLFLCWTFSDKAWLEIHWRSWPLKHGACNVLYLKKIGRNVSPIKEEQFDKEVISLDQVFFPRRVMPTVLQRIMKRFFFKRKRNEGLKLEPRKPRLRSSWLSLSLSRFIKPSECEPGNTRWARSWISRTLWKNGRVRFRPFFELKKFLFEIFRLNIIPHLPKK